MEKMAVDLYSRECYIYFAKKTSIAMVNINVFSQILGLIDRDIFGRLVQQYQSDKHHKGINSWTHFLWACYSAIYPLRIRFGTFLMDSAALLATWAIWVSPERRASPTFPIWTLIGTTVFSGICIISFWITYGNIILIKGRNCEDYNVRCFWWMLPSFHCA